MWVNYGSLKRPNWNLSTVVQNQLQQFKLKTNLYFWASEEKQRTCFNEAPQPLRRKQQHVENQLLSQKKFLKYKENSANILCWEGEDVRWSEAPQQLLHWSLILWKANQAWSDRLDIQSADVLSVTWPKNQRLRLRILKPHELRELFKVKHSAVSKCQHYIFSFLKSFGHFVASIREMSHWGRRLSVSVELWRLNLIFIHQTDHFLFDSELYWLQWVNRSPAAFSFHNELRHQSHESLD